MDKRKREGERESKRLKKKQKEGCGKRGILHDPVIQKYKKRRIRQTGDEDRCGHSYQDKIDQRIKRDIA